MPSGFCCGLPMALCFVLTSRQQNHEDIQSITVNQSAQSITVTITNSKTDSEPYSHLAKTYQKPTVFRGLQRKFASTLETRNVHVQDPKKVAASVLVKQVRCASSSAVIPIRIAYFVLFHHIRRFVKENSFPLS